MGQNIRPSYAYSSIQHSWHRGTAQIFKPKGEAVFWTISNIHIFIQELHPSIKCMSRINVYSDSFIRLCSNFMAYIRNDMVVGGQCEAVNMLISVWSSNLVNWKHLPSVSNILVRWWLNAVEPSSEISWEDLNIELKWSKFNTWILNSTLESQKLNVKCEKMLNPEALYKGFHCIETQAEGRVNAYYLYHSHLLNFQDR